MAGQKRGGGGRNNQAPARTENQQISDKNKIKELFRDVMSGIEGMRNAIEATLPREVSFDKFRAIVMMAVRHNPDILTCYVGSIITSCMKAAYDGVMLDGVEAALVPSNNKIVDPISKRESWRRDARYNIMIRGIRKQIIKGGKVRDFNAVIVYANEPFRRWRDPLPNLMHEQIAEHDKRGEPIGCYTIADFVDGGRPSIEYMTKKEIEDVRDMAQSGPVWKGKMYLEMWRKTVGRRHRKSLPGGNDVVDMEAREMFPQFANALIDEAAEGHSRSPTEMNAPPTPRRSDFQKLEDLGDDSGAPLDFGSTGEILREEAEREMREDQADEKPKQAAKAKPVEQHADEQGAAADGKGEAVAKEDPPAREIAEKPEDFDTWAEWEADITSKMKVSANIPKLDQVVKDSQAQYDVAPDEVRDRLIELYDEKVTDHREAVR